jgi:hypothetical protein
MQGMVGFLFFKSMLMLGKACGLGLYPTQKLIHRVI